MVALALSLHQVLPAGEGDLRGATAVFVAVDPDAGVVVGHDWLATTLAHTASPIPRPGVSLLLWRANISKTERRCSGGDADAVHEVDDNLASVDLDGDDPADASVLQELRPAARVESAVVASRDDLLADHELTAVGDERLSQLGDPAGLWRTTARGVLPRDSFGLAVGEVTLAILATGSTVPSEDLQAVVTEIVLEEGWRDASSHTPPERHTISRTIHTTTNLLRALNLLATGSDWNDRSCGLSDVGKATAMEALHHRATGPRPSPWG